MDGESVLNLPVIDKSLDKITINRQRLDFIGLDVPDDIMVQSTFYDSNNLALFYEFVKDQGDYIVGYLAFVLYMVLGVIAISLFQLITFSKDNNSDPINIKYRKFFCLFMVILCVIRMFQLMVELNVTPPDKNMIIGFCLYKVNKEKTIVKKKH